MAGVPGTGKSLVGSRVARLLLRRFTTLSWIVLEKGLWTGYDADRRSFIADYDRLVREIRYYQDYVVETHWLEPFETILDAIEAVVVTRCNPLVLLERLQRRGWPPAKIAENVEAELVGVVAAEARRLVDKGVPVVEIDTTQMDPDDAAKLVVDMIGRGVSRCCIDWLSVLEGDELGFLLEKLSSLGGAPLHERRGSAEAG
ncbi:adenylate kinase family protein [Pyrodictium occultum]|uniref:adenylate kinase family protein n=1 Tax=Pyrodictium occultum TaxID=2309 RepID=UPI001F3AB09D|nr:adenylate kinase family protein [Pyrodictium occultum]